MSHEKQPISDDSNINFPTFCWRIISTYMIAYIIAGSIAQVYYRPIWDAGVLSTIMRPMDSPWVALGPALQAVNAFMIAVVLYPLHSLIIHHKNGWLTLLMLIAGFSIFVPQAPAPSSFEGLIYTRLTIAEHLIGLPETLIFSLLFCTGVIQWYEHPKRIWNVISIFSVIIIFLISTLGYLAAVGIIPQS